MNDKYAQGVTYASSFITVFGGAWTLNEIAVISGTAIALCSFLYNVFCKERQHRIDLEYKQAMLNQIKEKDIISVANTSVDE